MLLQTCETFVHLRNTNEDSLDEIRELSDPPIDSKGHETFKVQKGTKNIIKSFALLTYTRMRSCLVYKQRKMHCALVNVRPKLTLKRRYCRIKSLWLNHWSHMECFDDVFGTFLDFESFMTLAFYGRFWQLSDFIQNIFIFGWTIPLKYN